MNCGIALCYHALIVDFGLPQFLRKCYVLVLQCVDGFGRPVVFHGEYDVVFSEMKQSALDVHNLAGILDTTKTRVK